jgi:hypothetical protein
MFLEIELLEDSFCKAIPQVALSRALFLATVVLDEPSSQMPTTAP